MIKRLLTLVLAGLPLAAAAQPAATPAERLKAARAAQDAGQLREAAEQYAELANDPDLSVRCVALEGAALVESWLGEYDDAVKHYRAVRDNCPEKRRDAIYGAARTLGWARDHRAGLDELAPLLEAEPHDRDLRMLDAQVAGWGGFYDRSVRSFRMVLERHPDDVEAMIGLAKVLSWASRLAESAHEFRKLLEKHPENDDALIGMTYTLLWMGRPHTAEEYFQRVSAAGQARREYRIAQSSLEWALQDRKNAVRHRNELMREFPGQPDVRDLWRAQTGVIGPNVRGEGTMLRDNQGLAVDTLAAGGTVPAGDAAAVFLDLRREWLDQDAEGGFAADSVTVNGGRVALEGAADRVLLRGSIGARESNVDTGGVVGGGSVRVLARRNIYLSAGVDSDFAFFTPLAVRNDVRMTTFSLAGHSAVSSRWTVSGNVSRTSFDGPDERVFTASDGTRGPVDQHRWWLAGSARAQVGGFGTPAGTVRLDLGARALYFRFDRQYADVGYWNPRRFRQLMGQGGFTFRRGEEIVWNGTLALGVQSQDDDDWSGAAYAFTEALYQWNRRFDIWARAEYMNSGFARRNVAGDDYSAWALAGGFLLRLGDRTPAPEPPGPRTPRAPRPTTPVVDPDAE